MKKEKIKKEKDEALQKINKKDEEEFDYIDMTDVNVENPHKKKFNLIVESQELEQIEEQNEPLTGMASEHPTGKFDFSSPDKADAMSSHSHASSVKQEALQDRIDQIKKELMGIQTKPNEDFESPIKGQDLIWNIIII